MALVASAIVSLSPQDHLGGDRVALVALAIVSLSPQDHLGGDRVALALAIA